MVEYKINIATPEQITELLRGRDEDFVPVLSSRVNLVDYGVKLKNNATNFEAWDGAKLVGIVSAYLNNFEAMQAYIPMVCVALESRGKGVARRLMHEFINYAEEKGFLESKLEVDKSNTSAVALYESLGYSVASSEKDALFMVRKGR